MTALIIYISFINSMKIYAIWHEVIWHNYVQVCTIDLIPDPGPRTFYTPEGARVVETVTVAVEHNCHYHSLNNQHIIIATVIVHYYQITSH